MGARRGQYRRCPLALQSDTKENSERHMIIAVFTILVGEGGETGSGTDARPQWSIGQ